MARGKQRKPRRPASDGGRRITVTVPGAAVPARPYPPGPHPGSDMLTVVWPGVRVPPGLRGAALGAWLADMPPGAVTVRRADVTRDEFTRRMAGHGVVAQVNADPRNRVIGLLDAGAVARWTEGGRQ